jgi:hypothetical protein
MFCPQCGSSQREDLKFCKACGVNLHAVAQVVTAREPDEKFDWSKTWVQEMFFSAEEKKRRKIELERQLGITPEMKRHKEIKAGVIVSSNCVRDSSVCINGRPYCQRQSFAGRLRDPESPLGGRCSAFICRVSTHNKRYCRQQETRGS